MHTLHSLTALHNLTGVSPHTFTSVTQLCFTPHTLFSFTVLHNLNVSHTHHTASSNYLNQGIPHKTQQYPLPFPLHDPSCILGGKQRCEIKECYVILSSVILLKRQRQQGIFSSICYSFIGIFLQELAVDVVSVQECCWVTMVLEEIRVL